MHALKFWTRLFCLGCLLLPLAAWAGRPVRVYEIDIKESPSGDALSEALKRVLVRATGRREAASDPALAGILKDAAHYMKGSRPNRDGSTHVIFDSAALATAVSAAGRSTWDSNRPFTLVVLSPPLTGAPADAARRELDAAAEARGLPITLVPLTLVDAAGADLSRTAILQAAQQLGGDAVLIGRSDSAGANGAWQWTLYTNFASENWSASLSGGLNNAVDALARVQDASEPQAEVGVAVVVEGVNALTDYAEVGRLLQAAPGVRSVDVVEANGTAVTFSVRARGGSAALDKALGASGHFAASSSGDSRLHYAYRP